jgi:hypothetical protein
VNPAEAAGRALHHIEHPYAHPTTWDCLNEPTREWWTERARPIADAVTAADKEP